MIVKYIVRPGEGSDDKTEECLFQSSNCQDPFHRVTDLALIRANSSGTPLILLLKKIVGSYTPDSLICSSCCDSLQQLDNLTNSAKHLQQQLQQRYIKVKQSRMGTNNISSTLNSVQAARQLNSGTTVAITPALSVTMMHEPMPKKHCYGIPEHEYLNSSLPSRQHHCGGYSCSPILFRHKKPSHQLAKMTNIGSVSSEKVVITHNRDGVNTMRKARSIKCSVGDLDKSHISSVFVTHDRSDLQNNDYSLSNNTIDTGSNNVNFSSQLFKQDQDRIVRNNEPQSLCSSLAKPQELKHHPFNSLLTPNRVSVGSTSALHNSMRVPVDAATTGDVQVVNMQQDSDDDSSSSDSDTSSFDSDNESVMVPQHSTAISNAAETAVSSMGGNTGLAAAQAILLSNPVASSLLHTFLATSLWLHGGSGGDQQEGQVVGSNDEESRQGSHHDNEDDSDTAQHEPVSDDVTCESLTVASSGVQDKNTRQELKNTGQSYVNTKGKMVQAKRVAPQDCSKCVMRCSAKLSEADRQSVFAEFWGLADYGKQREYLAEHMHREEKLGPSGLTRTVVLYYLTHRNKMQVCRQFFLKTLDVSEKASRIVLEKKVRGEFGSIGAPPPAPTHRTTSSRSRRTVANNQDSDYEY